jgi:hypothetical protein
LHLPRSHKGVGYRFSDVCFPAFLVDDDENRQAGLFHRVLAFEGLVIAVLELPGKLFGGVCKFVVIILFPILPALTLALRRVLVVRSSAAMRTGGVTIAKNLN